MKGVVIVVCFFTETEKEGIRRVAGVRDRTKESLTLHSPRILRSSCVDERREQPGWTWQEAPLEAEEGLCLTIDQAAAVEG